MRLDQILVERNISPSKSKAQALVRSGNVWVLDPTKGYKEFNQISKPGVDFHNSRNLLIRTENIEEQNYVARSGFKLAQAIKHLSLNLQDKVAMDVGQSTGGFTQALLQAGLKKVYGVDVGRDQLHPSVRQNPRVVACEGVNARDHAQVAKALNLEKDSLDIVVVDVSFISQKKILPSIVPFLKPQGHLLALVKPQFELSAKHLNKKGVVKDSKLLDSVNEDLQEFYDSSGLSVMNYFVSPILGGDGNQEFFIFANKRSL